MRSIVSLGSEQFWNGKDKNEKPHKMYSCHHCFVGGTFFLRITTVKCNAMAIWDRISFVMGTNNGYLNENIGQKKANSFFLVTINYCDELPHFCISLRCSACICFQSKRKRMPFHNSSMRFLFIYLHIFLHWIFLSLPTVWLRMDSVLVMNERYCFVVLLNSSSVCLVFSSFYLPWRKTMPSN